MAVRLIPLSDAARRVIGGEFLAIDRFPFRVGRESRSILGRMASEIERRLGNAPQVNDLYIVEHPLDQFHHVSREHFLIDVENDRYYLADRGSVCGTTVAGRVVGGNRGGGRVELHDQDVIVVGTTESPFVFRFDIS
jgi:pSer/pThr/pTyr-binding forkhead associated (FHA) protein